MRTIEQRLLDLERRVAGLEPQPVDELGDILRSYPGGISGLAEAAGYHRESIYQFAVAARSQSFPFKRASSIARAFGNRRALGKRVTVERLRSSWTEQFKKNKETEQ